jgi:hypothetical protein
MADIRPGDNGDKLKHYWLHGEGRAKWNTWTELYHHLVKYLNPETAKRVTSQWYHEATGLWGGSDANRVAHSHAPRGKVVGPG